MYAERAVYSYGGPLTPGARLLAGTDKNEFYIVDKKDVVALQQALKTQEKSHLSSNKPKQQLVMTKKPPKVKKQFVAKQRINQPHMTRAEKKLAWDIKQMSHKDYFKGIKKTVFQQKKNKNNKKLTKNTKIRPVIAFSQQHRKKSSPR